MATTKESVLALLEQYLHFDDGRDKDEDEILWHWRDYLVGADLADERSLPIECRAVLIDEIGRVWQVRDPEQPRWIFPSARTDGAGLRETAAGALAAELGVRKEAIVVLQDPLGRPIEIRASGLEPTLGIYFLFGGQLPAGVSRPPGAPSRWAPFDMLGHAHLGDKLTALAPGPTQSAGQ
jgi:hypothetical protein